MQQEFAQVHIIVLRHEVKAQCLPAQNIDILAQVRVADIFPVRKRRREWQQAAAEPRDWGRTEFGSWPWLGLPPCSRALAADQAGA